MKASELIKELEKAIEEHGDLEVEHSNDVDGRVSEVYFDSDEILLIP